MGKKKRRGAGEGTVYYRESDKRWVAELTLEDGKRKYFYAKKQEDAIQKLRQAQYEMKQGILATGPKQKVGDHLNYWLEQVHKRKIRTSTYMRYRGLLDTHILPALGQTQLQKLQMRTIQQFYNQKLNEGQSPGSVHSMNKVLHQACEQAVREHLISVNPCKGVSIPPEEKRKVQPLTLQQAQYLMQAAQGSMLEPFVALALAMGMRHGEILALHWHDIDFDQRTLYIHRTLTQVEGYRYAEGETKTASSERTLLLPHPVCDLLKVHKARQNEERLKAGPAWQDHDLVFCTAHNGGQLWAANVRQRFYRLLKKVGLPPMHIHDLRHNAVTLLISMGVNPKVVQEMLGHRDIAMTMEVYAHLLPSMQQEATEKMKNLFEKP